MTIMRNVWVKEKEWNRAKMVAQDGGGWLWLNSIHFIKDHVTLCKVM